MIYVTADLHGDVDRLRSLPVKLGRKDTLIVLGDFGFLWDGSKAEKKMLKWLGKRRYQLLFLDGAHENYDLLDSYEVTDFAGGRAQQISGKLYHLMRGEVYTIEEKKLLCFGGGESPDMDTRIEGQSWWSRELPSDEEYARCETSIAACDNQVDYVLTHALPARMLTFMNLETRGLLETNPLENYFDELATKLQYTHWYFGSQHRDQTLGPKATAVYKKVLPLFKVQRKK